MTDPSPIKVQQQTSTSDPPAWSGTYANQIGPLIADMQTSAYDLQRIGRALNAVAALTTSGDPAHTHLEVVNSEDLGALFNLIGDCVTRKSRGLEEALSRVAQVGKQA